MQAMETKLPDVEGLYVSSVDVTATWRDWQNSGDWEYFEAPSCPECDEYATWNPSEWRWECPQDEGDCPNAGQELDPLECGAEGPMMNYSYAIPEDIADAHAAAERIRDLPLCVVRWDDGSTALALTGGGMDLSWEIAEAFMRLGYLPPLTYCGLPQMAGKTIGPRERWVLAGCLRTCEVSMTRPQYIAKRLRDTYDV